jgi:Holliday junction resolvase RusA-like endonuclease
MILHAYGVPVPQGSKRWTGRTMVDQNHDELASWRSDIGLAVRHYKEHNPEFKRFECPLLARVIFTFQRPPSVSRKKRPFHSVAPDLDKLARGVGDALQAAGAIANDSLIVEFTRLAKVYVGEDPEALETSGALIVLGCLVPLAQVGGSPPDRSAP